MLATENGEEGGEKESVSFTETSYNVQHQQQLIKCTKEQQ